MTDENKVFHGEIGYATPDEALRIRREREAHELGERTAERTVKRSARWDPDYAGDRNIGTEDMVDGILPDEQVVTNKRHLNPITVENVSRAARKIRSQEKAGTLSKREAGARIEKLRQQYPGLLEEYDETLES